MSKRLSNRPSRVVILPYNQASQSAKLLAQTMNLLRLKRHNSSFRARPQDVIINWGISDSLPTSGHKINPAACVKLASNKLHSFQQMQEYEIQTVPWTSNGDEAIRWLNEGSVVYARHQLGGHSGAGIEVIDPKVPPSPNSSWTAAPLYTKAVGYNKRWEYRIHVVAGEVVLVQQKKRRNGWKEDPNFSNIIRNHHTGWIYATQEVQLPEGVADLAIRSVACLGLDFGAVDVIVVEGQGYVLEVNTAPGLDGSTVEVYATALSNLVRTITE